MVNLYPGGIIEKQQEKKKILEAVVIQVTNLGQRTEKWAIYLYNWNKQ